MYVLEYDGWYFVELNEYDTPMCLQDISDKRVCRFKHELDAKLYKETFQSMKKFTVIETEE